jgi:hypothetical protein
MELSPFALSRHSPEGIIVVTQETDAVVTALFGEYREYLWPWQATYHILGEFFGRFELAGRRPSQMSDKDQVLCDLLLVRYPAPAAAQHAERRHRPRSLAFLRFPPSLAPMRPRSGLSVSSRKDRI